MDPKRDKAYSTRKDAQELADYIDSQPPRDNTPKTEGKRAEDSDWRAHEECAGETYEPERSYAAEPAKKEVTDPAEYSRDFREYCDEPTHERGGQAAWKKEREDKLVDALYDLEREQAESGK